MRQAAPDLGAGGDRNTAGGQGGLDVGDRLQPLLELQLPQGAERAGVGPPIPVAGTAEGDQPGVTGLLGGGVPPGVAPRARPTPPQSLAKKCGAKR